MATARKSFESILLDRSWVSAQDLDKARQRKKPGQELAAALVEMGALEPQRLARALAQQYRLPFQAHIDEHTVDNTLVLKVPINDAINRAYDQATSTPHDLMIDLGEERLDLVASELAQEPKDLLESDDAAPIIRLVNGLLSQAVKDRASDIHIEPFERELVIRFRVDGMMYDVLSPPKRFQPAITSRVKVMAGLNIAEKRLPQDGRIRLRI